MRKAGPDRKMDHEKHESHERGPTEFPPGPVGAPKGGGGKPRAATNATLPTDSRTPNTRKRIGETDRSVPFRVFRVFRVQESDPVFRPAFVLFVVHHPIGPSTRSLVFASAPTALESVFLRGYRPPTPKLGLLTDLGLVGKLFRIDGDRAMPAASRTLASSSSCSAFWKLRGWHPGWPRGTCFEGGAAADAVGLMREAF